MLSSCSWLHIILREIKRPTYLITCCKKKNLFNSLKSCKSLGLIYDHVIMSNKIIRKFLELYISSLHSQCMHVLTCFCRNQNADAATYVRCHFLPPSLSLSSHSQSSHTHRNEDRRKSAFFTTFTGSTYLSVLQQHDTCYIILLAVFGGGGCQSYDHLI